MLPDVVIGLALGGGFLLAGTASWYHPTLFLVLFDEDDVDPWPQLLFTPAAYIGGLFLVFTFGGNLYYVQAVVGLAVGAAVLLRHDREPRGDGDIWPSRTVGRGVLAVGVFFVVVGAAATAGLVEPL